MSVDRAVPSLRRLDWRFLLPLPASGSFDHLYIPGASLALAEMAVHTGLARRVSVTEPTTLVDAVALLAGCRMNPVDVVHSLLEDAVMCWEVDRYTRPSWRLSQRRARRMLDDIGMSEPTVYWVRPSFAAVQLAIPVHGAALRWFLTTLDKPSRALTAATSAVMNRSEVYLPRLVTAAMPRFILIGQRGVTSPTPTLMGATAMLPARAPGPSDRPPMLVAHNKNDWGRIVVVPFPRHGPPSTVLKLARSEKWSQGLRDEQHRLERIRALAGPSASALPKPLGVVDICGHTVSVESAVMGQPIARSSGRWGASRARQRDDLRHAMAWITRFHRHTSVRSTASPGAWRRHVAAPFEAYVEQFAHGQAVKSLFAALTHSEAALGDRPIPIVWQHRDLGVGNVYRAKGAVHVIDWELARRGLALSDALFFCWRWAVTVAGGRHEPVEMRELERLYIADATDGSWEATAVAQEIDRYCTALSIDSRWVPIVLVTALAELALDTRARQLQVGAWTRQTWVDNAYARLLAHIAVRRSDLFQRWRLGVNDD